MTTILYKRLKVDNGFRVWHYTGVLVDQVQAKELYDVNFIKTIIFNNFFIKAKWKPTASVFYPERKSLSPPPIDGIVVPKAAEKKAGAYRPPGARGNNAPNFMVSLFLLPLTIIFLE